MRGTWERADPGAAGSGAAVETEGRGRIAVFRGIPYAEPPVGSLRFARPQPRAAWTGVREARAFGPTPQRGETGMTLIPEHSVPGDDTLSVNVWTPDPDPAAALPVLVWIHGGGYISGSPASPWYDGRAFARDGVVLVTVSYRLGFAGFGWVEDATPNRGVLDWVCALRWVRDHIAAFGGDPSRVTIAGQSAGGGAVLTLLGVPDAAGLFSGGYAISPAVADPSAAAARRRALRLARLAGVTADAAGFASVPESKLLALQPRITSPAAPHLLHDVHAIVRAGLLLGPVADGDVVPVDTLAALTEGPSAGVPLVLGTADDELTGLFRPGGLLDRAPRRVLLRALGASREAAEAWLRTRRAAECTGSAELLGRYLSDAVFRSWVPRAAEARAVSAVAGPTWSYRFAWHPDDPPRAGHCGDVPFVFDRLDAAGVERVAGPQPPQALADAIHGAVVAFARDRDPGWPADTAGSGPSRIFDLPVRDEPGAYDDARTLLAAPPAQHEPA
ncbi:carboxylesterase/lipase family protein [Leucobacter massiliensis]|uniref:carboxylesterase/lipase family protein n=1 Tax=Leucobacter massiliensis TaxID=1686285 RepID=UPI001FE536ED|nr:carboxylesterase family protein [Leucobacter massiliensis]